jgi:outer membrane lipoprotein-sorting protein
MKTLKKICFLFLILTSSLSALPTGEEVTANINSREEGIAVSRNLRMEMTDRRGKQRIRETRAFRKYYGDEKRTAIFYLSPKNVKDTAFLTWDYPERDRDDDQWLYLPAMKRVRRISASDRGDFFLGTDFTFEEIKLESRVSEVDFVRTTIGEGEVDGFPTYTVEGVATSEAIERELGVARREDHVDKSIWMIRKSLLFDRKGKHVKTIHFKDIESVQGIWSAMTIIAENHKTGHRTEFKFSDVVYEDSMADEVFSQRNLMRGYRP